MAKKEFQLSKIPIMTSRNQQIDNSRSFQKSMTQKFVKNYVSEYTPYNGILLWHEVGVGKTCAGISIAENFIDYVEQSNQKILILTPRLLLNEQIVEDKYSHYIKEYNYKNINVYNNDYIDIYMNIKQDIIYFDPPWNDINYKNIKNIDLFINDNNILNIINLLLTKKKTKICILYTPANYNFNNIKNIILNNKIYIKNIINKYIIFFF